KESDQAAKSDDGSLACELHAARGDGLHPLHTLAIGLERQLRPDDVTVEQSPEYTPVVQFSEHPETPTPVDWLVTGVSFGDAPRPAGTLALSLRKQDPLSVVEYAAATPNASSWGLRGTYRTKTFEVTGKSLWYAYRGKADVF